MQTSKTQAKIVQSNLAQILCCSEIFFFLSWTASQQDRLFFRPFKIYISISQTYTFYNILRWGHQSKKIDLNLPGATSRRRLIPTSPCLALHCCGSSSLCRKSLSFFAINLHKRKRNDPISVAAGVRTYDLPHPRSK